MQKILVLVDETLANECNEQLSMWCQHIESYRNCKVQEIIRVREGTVRFDLRSKIIHIVRKHKKAGVGIEGVQIFGTKIDTFWFMIGAYSLQTDALYGNWTNPENRDTTWENLNLDTILVENEFPSRYEQNAWVARWGGMNVTGENESVLFRRFVARTTTKKRGFHHFDAAIVYLDKDASFAVFGHACDNIRRAFPVVLDFHGDKVVPYLLEEPGLLTKKRLRYLAFFGHGGSNWIGDLKSQAAFTRFAMFRLRTNRR